MQDTDPAPSPSQAARLAAWIRLEQAPGVGRFTAGNLLAQYHTPDAIFAASHATLAGLVTPRQAAALLAPPEPGAIARALAWDAAENQAILTLDDPRYPAILREIADPPLLLYVIGRPAVLAGPALAIVGSRNATAQGVANARAFAQALSATGLTIVSGMALGIDTAAHDGALQAAGSTVAVIGTGADLVYPPRNEALARRIAAAGCIVSEYALGTPPLPENFPRRNRIISGLCRGVLVVEAAKRSGSLITAHVANDQGRDVFAIPGSIHAPLSKGCHKLIKEGAKLVESAADILQELGMAASPAPGPAPTPAPGPDDAGQHGALLHALGHDPVSAERLLALTGTPPSALSSQLLALELAGHVERLPGGLFQRVKH